MLLVAPLLLAIIAAVNSQKTITWTQQLPQDYVLINKDQLSVPIDEYVSLSGSIFTANDPTRNVIIPKIQFQKEAISSQGNNMQSCSISDNSKEKYVIFVCNKNFIRIERDANFMIDSKDNTTSLSLLTPSGQSPALKDVSTFCTDIYILNGRYLVNCYDTSNLTNPLYIFSVAESITPTSPVNIGTCDTGDLKGDNKMAFLISSTPKTPVIFYDVSRFNNTSPGTISAPYCNVDVSSSFIKSSSTQNDLFKIINNSTLSKGVLRFITSVSNTDLLAFIATDDSVANKSLYIVPLTINDVGNISLNANYSITQFNGTGIQGFNPMFMTFTKASGAMQFVASDKANLYAFNINPSMTLQTPVWNVVLDCGLAADNAYYISRIDISGGNRDITNPTSRTLIVYSTVDNKKVREFAVHINNTKYACSRATNAVDSFKLSTVNTVSFGADSTLLVSADNKLSTYKINYNTILSIAITEETTDRTVDLSASMNGWTSPAGQKFTYKSLKNANDFNNITLGVKSFKSYANTSSFLAISPASFRGNNPKISTTSANVQLHYTASPSVSLTGLNISDYDINRIFAVDEDSYVAVLRRANGSEAFVRFWNRYNGVNNTLDLANSSIIILNSGQIIFKMFKLGPNILCAVIKSNGGTSKKLSFSCYDDKKEAPIREEANNKEITDTFEVSDIQILETESSVQLFMVGTDTSIQNNAVLYYFVSLDSNGKVFSPPSTYVKKIDITDKNLPEYYPTDIMFDVWGDTEGTSYLTIKQVSKLNLQPVVSKYNISEGTSVDSPVKLTYIYHMYIPSADMAFCAIKNEIIFFSPKIRQIVVNKMVRVPTGVTLPQNKIFLPVAEYNIVYFKQFVCIPEKGIFQVLGLDANKFLINFRAGESTNGARRVHSVISLAQTVTFIESAFNNEFIVTVANTPGKLDVARNFVYTYYDGPRFVVDNRNAKDSYDVAITSSSASGSNSQATVRVEIVQPKFKAELKPREKFEITDGKTIFLDQVSTIEGPVMDIRLEGTDASKVTLVKRNNKFKGFSAGETTTADRIQAENGFMAFLWTGSRFKVLGDPATIRNSSAPTEILSESATNVKDLQLIKYGNSENEAILITRVYSGTTYKYSIFHLTRIANTTGGFTYAFVRSENLYETTTEFDSLQVVTIGTGNVVIALKMKRAFNSNYIRLISFQKNTGNKFTLLSNVILTVDLSKDIGGHSLVWDKGNNVAVVGYYKDTETIILAVWDGVSTSPRFRESSTKVRFSDTEFVSLTLGYIRCWPGNNSGSVECLVDASGVVDYLLLITPEPTQKPDLDPIMSIVKVAEFEMPPHFDIRRTDRGKDYFGFLLKKSSISTVPSARRLLQTSMALDSFSACNHIIAFYKPSAGRFIYTGITCSEWGNNTNIDFAMESDFNEFVYITRWPAPVAGRLLQNGTTDRVSASYLAPIQVTVNGAVDPNQVKLTFVGLNGPNDPIANPAVTLNDFKQGSPPPPPATSSSSSFWTWFIIILVVLLIIGGAVYGYIWYQNNQSSSSSSSYTKQADRDNSKSDLEDTRL
jgi:hypothetical protein